MTKQPEPSPTIEQLVEDWLDAYSRWHYRTEASKGLLLSVYEHISGTGASELKAEAWRYVDKVKAEGHRE